MAAADSDVLARCRRDGRPAGGSCGCVAACSVVVVVEECSSCDSRLTDAGRRRNELDGGVAMSLLEAPCS